MKMYQTKSLEKVTKTDIDAEKIWLIENCINIRKLALRAGAGEYNDDAGYIVGLEHVDEITRAIMAMSGWLWYEVNCNNCLSWNKMSNKVKTWYDRAESWLSKNDFV